MVAGCLQLIWVHLRIIWVRDPRYSQLIWAENRDVCGSGHGCLRAATATPRAFRSSKRPIRSRSDRPSRSSFQDRERVAFRERLEPLRQLGHAGRALRRPRSLKDTLEPLVCQVSKLHRCFSHRFRPANSLFMTLFCPLILAPPSR